MLTNNQFVQKLNILMKQGNCVDAQKLLTWFCREYIPINAKVPQEWSLDLSSPNRIRDGMICVMAHSKSAKRVLAVIKRTPDCSEVVPEQFRYTYERLQIKKRLEPIPGKKSKERRVVEYIEEVSNSSQLLITPRRGLWVIWQPSLDVKITKGNMKEFEELLIKWYRELVMGMEKEPSSMLEREREDYEYEQFKLYKYPTDEWKEHTLGLKRMNRKQVHFKNKEGPGMPPPPPPPDDVDLSAGGKRGRKRQRGGAAAAGPTTAFPQLIGIDGLPVVVPAFDMDSISTNLFKYYDNTKQETASDSGSSLSDDDGGELETMMV
jgi:hypothetical protein